MKKILVLGSNSELSKEVNNQLSEVFSIMSANVNENDISFEFSGETVLNVVIYDNFAKNLNILDLDIELLNERINVMSRQLLFLVSKILKNDNINLVKIVFIKNEANTILGEMINSSLIRINELLETYNGRVELAMCGVEYSDVLVNSNYAKIRFDAEPGKVIASKSAELSKKIECYFDGKVESSKTFMNIIL